MIVRGHTFNTFMFTEPWLNIAAVIVGLILFFYVCAARVQGESLSNAQALESSVSTNQIKTVARPSHLDSQLWRGDISDISNEKAGNVPDRKVKTDFKHMNAAKFLLGSPSSTVLPPSFVGP